MQNVTQATTRQHQRVRVELYINKITSDSPHMARVRDLSAGGMFLYRLIEPNSVSAAQEFTVEMQLPGETELIWAAVQVVRDEHTPVANADGYAVRFCRLTESDRLRINRFVETQKDKPSSIAQRKN